jgi:Domain of unknown function (DUF4349)
MGGDNESLSWRAAMKKHSLFLVICPLLLVTGCSPSDGGGGGDGTTADASATGNRADVSAVDVAEEAASAMKAPGISASVAPNLAFEYRYAFKLPDDRIGAVQEQHAEACETLGSARCQVVDMRYQQINENEAEAMLAFKLDPAIARRFGRDAIATVEKAEGVLADGNVTGTNVGGAIEDSQGRSALVQAQLERLEKRLSLKGLPPKERASLQDRAEELRKELDGEQEGRRQGETKLAMTPVQFTYTSDGGVPGFGKHNPFASAFDVSANSFATMVSFVLLILGAVLPWALLLGLILLLLKSKAAKGLRTWWTRNTPLTDAPLKD